MDCKGSFALLCLSTGNIPACVEEWSVTEIHIDTDIILHENIVGRHIKHLKVE